MRFSNYLNYNGKKHPHASGENLTLTSSINSLGETPPREWGKLSRHNLPVAVQGNTPTRVGKILCFFYFHYTSEKHPHASGENRHNLLLILWCQETPPREWGKFSMTFKSVRFRRNTPTRVGKIVCLYQHKQY